MSRSIVKLLFFVGLLTAPHFAEPPAARAESARIDRAYKRLAVKYGFSIPDRPVFKNNIRGDRAPADKVEDELDRFFAALENLTVSFVRRTGVNKVIVCENLAHGGMKPDGLATEDSIYLKVGFQERTVYHEFYHVFDDVRHEDKKWRALNPPGFRYPQEPPEKSAHRKTETAAAGARDDWRKHFVTDYARTAEWEDRAETFSMMVHEGPKFMKRVEQSDVLRAKMEYIIEQTSRASLLGRDYWSERLGLTRQATDSTPRR